MKDIEKILQKSAGTKPGRPLRANFTREVTNHIKSHPRPQSRWQTFKENIAMNIIHKPVMAGVSALAVIALSSSAYAALNWFGTDVQTQAADNIVTVSNKDCPNQIANASYGDWKPRSDSETTYKILKPEVVTPEDIKNSHLVSCERNAIDSLAAQYFPASYDYAAYDANNGKNGMYLAASNYGTVVAISDNDITVQDVHVNNSPFASDSTTVTLRVQADTRVLDQGKATTLSGLKAGDQVYFVFQNKIVPKNTDVRQMSIPGKDNSNVLLIAKTQYDYRLMDKFMKALVQNGPVEVIKTNDPNAGG